MKNTESTERGSTTNQDTSSSGSDDSPCYRRVPMKIKFKHNRMITTDMVMVRGKLCKVLEWGRGQCVALVPENLSQNDESSHRLTEPPNTVEL